MIKRRLYFLMYLAATQLVVGGIAFGSIDKA